MSEVTNVRGGDERRIVLKVENHLDQDFGWEVANL